VDYIVAILVGLGPGLTAISTLAVVYLLLSAAINGAPEELHRELEGYDLEWITTGSPGGCKGVA